MVKGTLAKRYHADDKPEDGPQYSEHWIMRLRISLAMALRGAQTRGPARTITVYEAALREIITYNNCLCGGEGYCAGQMIHVEGQGEDRFGHQPHAQCSVVIAAKALGLRMEVR